MYKVIIDLREIDKEGTHCDINYEYSDKKAAHKVYKKLVKRWKRGGVFELPYVGGFAVHSSDVLRIRLGKEG